MRVGINPIQWPKETSLETILPAVAELGYQGIAGAREYVGQAAALRTLLADHGLHIAAGHYAANWFDKEWRPRELNGLRKHAEFYAELSAASLVVASLGSVRRLQTAGHLPSGRTDGMTDYQWEFFAESVSLAGQIARDEFQIELVFRNQAGTYVETAEEVDRLISLTDPQSVFLAPDTGHLFYAGIDPARFFERNVDRIRLVHLKDVSSDRREQALAARASLMEFAQLEGFTEIGVGAIDFEAIFEILRKHEYKGWLIVEQEHTSRDPAVSAGESIEFVNSLLRV